MQTLTLNRQALLALIVATAFPLSALAGVGNVEFTTGTVNAQSADGATRTLSKGAEVNIGDTLKTLSGRMQVKFSDGGYISLQPNTEFTIDEYNYTGNKDGKEKGFFKLVKGGLRAITGAIGKTDKENYKVSTPTATIGIRGTEYVALQEGDRLQVKVGAGAVVIQNDAGNLVLYQGQSGEVSGPTSAPQQSTETPSVTAAAPAGNSVTETTEESSTDSIYVDGNVRLDDDTLCQTGDGSCTDQVVTTISSTEPNVLLQGGLSNIPTLNSLGASAVYVGSNSFSFAGSTADVTESLGIDFSDYVAFFSVTGSFSSGALSGQSILVNTVDSNTLSDTGSLNPSTGTLTFGQFSGFYGNGGTPITGSASGSLSSSNLSQATITYLFSDGSNTLAPVTTTLSGVAFIPAILETGLSGLTNLNAQDAFGTYNGSSSFTLQGTTFSNIESMTIDFGTYTATLNVSGSGDSAGVYANHMLATLLQAQPVGSLSSTGVINFGTGSGELTFSSLVQPVTINPAGQLNSSNLSQATVTYTINDGSTNSSIATSNMTGSLD